MQRTGLVSVLVLATLLAAPAALATGDAQLAPPIELSEGVEFSLGATVGDLLSGSSPITVSVTTGTLELWQQRTPCLDRNLQSCLWSSASRTSRSLELAPGSVVSLQHVDGASYRLLIDAPAGARVDADTAVVELNPKDATRSIGDAAPDRYTTATLPQGPVVLADRPSFGARGDLLLRPVNATVDAIDHEGQQHHFVTGQSWTSEDDGVRQVHQIQHVNIRVDGRIAFTWDGVAAIAAATPIGIEAGEASFELLDGALVAPATSPGEHTLSDVELTLSGYDLAAGERGAFEVSTGAPVADQPPAEDDDLGTVALVGAGAALAAMIGAVGYYWPRMSWGLAVVGLPMYSRIERSELLDHNVREQLYEFIQDEPGIHAHALSEKAEIGWGTTVYHLRLMERNRLVTSERKGRYRRFFPAAGFLAKKREVLSVLQNETTNNIARLVLREPGLNQKAICEALEISPSLANWHLNRLLDAELVDRERRGRTVHYFPGAAWEDVQDVVDMDASAS